MKKVLCLNILLSMIIGMQSISCMVDTKKALQLTVGTFLVAGAGIQCAREIKHGYFDCQCMQPTNDPLADKQVKNGRQLVHRWQALLWSIPTTAGIGLLCSGFDLMDFKTFSKFATGIPLTFFGTRYLSRGLKRLLGSPKKESTDEIKTQLQANTFQTTNSESLKNRIRKNIFPITISLAASGLGLYLFYSGYGDLTKK